MKKLPKKSFGPTPYGANLIGLKVIIKETCFQRPIQAASSDVTGRFQSGLNLTIFNPPQSIINFEVDECFESIFIIDLADVKLAGNNQRVSN